MIWFLSNTITNAAASKHHVFTHIRYRENLVCVCIILEAWKCLYYHTILSPNLPTFTPIALGYPSYGNQPKWKSHKNAFVLSQMLLFKQLLMPMIHDLFAQFYFQKNCRMIRKGGKKRRCFGKHMEISFFCFLMPNQNCQSISPSTLQELSAIKEIMKSNACLGSNNGRRKNKHGC